MPEVVIPGRLLPFAHGRSPDVRMDLLAAIKETNSSSTTKHIAKGLKDFFENPQNRESQIPQLVLEGSSYTRALLLSAYTANNIPDFYKSNLGIKKNLYTRARPIIAHNSWTLCNTSEARMVTALSENTTVIVGGLMVKFKGRTSAFCFESFSTNFGTFIEGNFYSPDRDTQHKLKDLFIKGFNNPHLSSGDWYLMRGIQDSKISEKELINMAREKIQHFPESIPEIVNGISRSEYIKAGEKYPDEN